jgi:hypothetical protein
MTQQRTSSTTSSIAPEEARPVVILGIASEEAQPAAILGTTKRRCLHVFTLTCMDVILSMDVMLCMDVMNIVKFE